MSTSSQPTSESQSTVLSKFLEETIRFLSSQKYLLTVATVAQDKASPVSEAHEELVRVLAPLYDSPYDYLVARLFIGQISAFELFLQETVAEVIAKYPKKVGGAQFTLSDILDASSTAALVARAAEELLNRLMYKKPLEYLSDICSLLSIEEAPL